MHTPQEFLDLSTTGSVEKSASPAPVEGCPNSVPSGEDFSGFTAVTSRKQLRHEKARNKRAAEEEAGREAEHEAKPALQPRASDPRSQQQPSTLPIHQFRSLP